MQLVTCFGWLLGCSYAVTMAVTMALSGCQGVAMELLGCSGWLIRRCEDSC